MAYVQLYAEFSQAGVSATPGVCYLCHTDRQPKAEGVVSTGHFIEAEGVLELCKSCVLELAAQFGVVEPSTTDRLRSTNRRLGRQLKAALDSQAAQAVLLAAQASQIDDFVELTRG